MTIGKVHLTKRYARYRIKNPKSFKNGSLKIQALGKRGITKRIAGRLKTTNKWSTQAILITRDDYKKGKRVRIDIYGKPKIYIIHTRK
ncbi:MAG: hypothetical protein MUO82_10840 [Candidatus Thermoplasmatota archaeon]|nr:hypothetical protein [Candidatus Thermoplasmatota archaeon]